MGIQKISNIQLYKLKHIEILREYEMNVYIYFL